MQILTLCLLAGFVGLSLGIVFNMSRNYSRQIKTQQDLTYDFRVKALACYNLLLKYCPCALCEFDDMKQIVEGTLMLEEWEREQNAGCALS